MEADEIRAELERILAYDDMQSSRQMSSFLRFVVEQALAGRAAQIKERTIAIGALDRETDFDPRIDPIVRVVAAKLRRTLERYNLSIGASDSVRIDIPKGGYVPRFISRSESTPEDSVTTTARSSDLILRTKLHAPPVTPDWIRQTALLTRLDRHRHLPLTLVSAPAGYGKSTLLSAWLDECDVPSAWLSLDEDDNDLREFVAGFVAAVQTLFPAAGEATRALLAAPDLPPVHQLSRRLLNDLQAIDEAFVLVLDDYHVLHEQAVHDLLTELLRHPPQSMHLAVLTRKDPPLALDQLRGRGQVLELSMFDLRFTPSETAEFLGKVLRLTLSDAAARTVAERIEGWPAGLHLLAQSLRHQEDPDRAITLLRGDVASVASYLISEVLSKMPPTVSRSVLKLSILDRFCDALCQLLCDEDLQAGDTALDGRALIAWLRTHNLFVIALDNEHRWFRFHHLFQSLLGSRLEQRFESQDVAALHSKASAWFESQKLIGEAIDHAVAAGDLVGAAEVFERHRHAEQDADRWRNLEKWLAKLPVEIRRQRPGLLLAQAWVLHDRYQLRDLVKIVEAIEPLIEEEEDATVPAGEFRFFRGVLLFWQGEGERSFGLIEEARERIPRSYPRMRGLIEIYLGLARQMIGQEQRALDASQKESQTSQSLGGPLHSRVILAQALVHTVAGQLAPAAELAQLVEIITEKAGIAYMAGWGRYLQGASAFRLHDLEAAIRHFAPTRTDPYVMHTRSAIDALVGLAIAEQAMGRPDMAAETMSHLAAFARETGESEHLAIAHSGQARLALAQDDLESAVRWEQACDEEGHAPTMFIWLENPIITQIRVLIEVGSTESLQKASHKLHRLRHELESLHNTCQLIDIGALQSLALHRQGRTNDALEALDQTITMAEPGGWIWPFVETGPPMIGLLERLVERSSDGRTFARRLLAKLSRTAKTVEH